MANDSESKQVNVSLAAFAMKAAPAAPKAGTRKPMSEETKQKTRNAQLRRHQPDAATSNAASTTE
jgi:hypothetical protein